MHANILPSFRWAPSCIIKSTKEKTFEHDNYYYYHLWKTWQRILICARARTTFLSFQSYIFTSFAYAMFATVAAAATVVVQPAFVFFSLSLSLFVSVGFRSTGNISVSRIEDLMICIQLRHENRSRTDKMIMSGNVPCDSRRQHNKSGEGERKISKQMKTRWAQSTSFSPYHTTATTTTTTKHKSFQKSEKENLVLVFIYKSVEVDWHRTEILAIFQWRTERNSQKNKMSNWNGKIEKQTVATASHSSHPQKKENTTFVVSGERILICVCGSQTMANVKYVNMQSEFSVEFLFFFSFLFERGESILCVT